MSWHSWLLVVLGVWILVSPWVLGFSALNLVLWNNVLSGILLVALALSELAPPRGDA